MLQNDRNFQFSHFLLWFQTGKKNQEESVRPAFPAEMLVFKKSASVMDMRN